MELCVVCSYYRVVNSHACCSFKRNHTVVRNHQVSMESKSVFFAYSSSPSLMNTFLYYSSRPSRSQEKMPLRTQTKLATYLQDPLPLRVLFPPASFSLPIHQRLVNFFTSILLRKRWLKITNYCHRNVQFRDALIRSPAPLPRGSSKRSKIWSKATTAIGRSSNRKSAK